MGENSKRRQLEYDVLGRLTSSAKYGATGGDLARKNLRRPATGPKYTYDANGHLTNVTQKAQAASGQQQTRTYVYDDWPHDIRD